jgi:hypothetical protein
MVIAALLLAGIVATRATGYLLFHSLAEFIGITIAVGSFIVAWHSRDIAPNPFFLFLGVASVAVAGVDLVHALAFKGMGVFAGATANLPTQLWIAARYLESLSLLAAPLAIGRRPRPLLLLAVFIAAAGLNGAAVFSGYFPVSYVEGAGLTVFKRVSEYAISTVYLAAAAHLLIRRSAIDRRVLALILGSLGIRILAEIAFTLYVDVTDVYNMAGHVLRILAAALVYRAIVVTGFENPYRLLFRDVKRREEQLEQALSRIKTLSGLLPICASCKKVRNDAGYWQQIESYISAHSEAEFTHSLCPDCEKALYPGFLDRDSTDSESGGPLKPR